MIYSLKNKVGTWSECSTLERSIQVSHSCVIHVLSVSALRYEMLFLGMELTSEFQTLTAKPCLILDDWRQMTVPTVLWLWMPSAAVGDTLCLLVRHGLSEWEWERERERERERLVKVKTEHDKMFKLLYSSNTHLHMLAQTFLSLSHTHTHTLKNSLLHT